MDNDFYKDFFRKIFAKIFVVCEGLKLHFLQYIYTVIVTWLFDVYRYIERNRLIFHTSILLPSDL